MSLREDIADVVTSSTSLGGMPTRSTLVLYSDQSEESWLKVGGAKGVDELKGCRGQDKMHFNKYGNESSSGTLLEFKNKDMELKIE